MSGPGNWWLRVVNELCWHGICELEVKQRGDLEDAWVETHVRRLHGIAEDLERTGVIDAVLWDKLREPMTGNGPLPNVGLVACEVSLGLEVEETLTRNRLKEVNRMIELCGN